MEKNIKLVMWVIIIILFAVILRAAFEIVIEVYGERQSFSQFLNQIIRYSVTVFVILIWISIVARSDHPTNKLPWLMILALEPFIGLGLFLTLGRSFRRSERFKERPLLHDSMYLTKEPATDFNREGYLKIDSEITDIYKAGYNSTKHHAYLNDTLVTVLTNGEQKFPQLKKDLKEAKEFILMQYYILRTDNIGKQILKLLKEKAEEGLDVYLLYDSFGSVFLQSNFLKELKLSGVKIVVNDPVYFGIFNTRLNFRNHRKNIVIDGKIGYVGGINLGDEYLATNHKKLGFLRDTHLRLEGDAVNSLTQLFFRDWYYNTSDFISDDRFFKKNKIKTDGLVQIIPSGPDFIYPPIRNVYVKMINNAKESIKIMTPYIALDQELMSSLVIAAKSGVDVHIIIPSKPDKHSVYTVTKSFVEPLLEAGINVYQYQPGFCHAKVFIIDDKLASCGSYNFDNRSARINFELTCLVYNQAVQELANDFNEDLKKSKQILLKQWQKRNIVTRFYEGVLNLFSPIV